MECFIMNRQATGTAEYDNQQTSEWVTPVLSRMSVEHTLSGRFRIPIEEILGGRTDVPGDGGS